MIGVLNREFYDYLYDSIEGCVCEIPVEALNNMSIVILGSNITKEFDNIVNKLIDNDNLKIHMVAQHKQIKNLPEALKARMDVTEWNASYRVEMFDELRKKEFFSEVNGILFLGAASINLRDLNIIGMGVSLKRECGLDTYIYDYNDEKIYQYKDIELYYAGINVYKDINEFLELAEENTN